MHGHLVEALLRTLFVSVKFCQLFFRPITIAVNVVKTWQEFPSVFGGYNTECNAFSSPKTRKFPVFGGGHFIFPQCLPTVNFFKTFLLQYPAGTKGYPQGINILNFLTVVPISYPSGITVKKIKLLLQLVTPWGRGIPKIMVLRHIGSLIDTHFSMYINTWMTIDFHGEVTTKINLTQ